MKKKRTRAVLALMCAAATSLALMLPTAAFADEKPAAEAAECTLSVAVAESDSKAYPELDDLTFSIKLFKVAELGEDGSVTPLEAYAAIEGLSGLTPFSDAETVDAISAALAGAVAPEIDEDSGETVKDGKTPDYTFSVAHLKGKFSGADKGLYLMTADDAHSDHWSYSAKPLLVMLPMASAVVNDEFIWDNDAAVVLKLEQNPLFGDLEIVKTLSSPLREGEDAAFVFHVKATVTDDANETTEVVYDDVHTISFTQSGTKSITITDLPAGADVVVEEVYSGRFVALGDSIKTGLVISADELCKAEFTNTYFPTLRRGSSVENIYTYIPYDNAEGGAYAFSEQIYHYWFISD